MGKIDELDGLELIAAFARALGHKADTHYAERLLNSYAYAGLILQEINRIKPGISWLSSSRKCWVFSASMEGEGPDLQTAMARLVVKLKENSNG